MTMFDERLLLCYDNKENGGRGRGTGAKRTENRRHKVTGEVEAQICTIACLEVYQRPYDPLSPVACIDETNKQLIQKTRVP